MKRILWTLCGLILTTGLMPARSQEPQAPGPLRELSVMTFNVENLFDTQDDPRKSDETFLPRALKDNARHKKLCAKVKREKWRKDCLEWDWSEEVLKIKFTRLTQVIKSVEAGRGPDVLVLQEVENKGVVERWRTEYLSDLGYLPVTLIDGPDKRGIDVAVLSRRPVRGRPFLHRIPFQGLTREQRLDTRGILQVDLQLEGADVLTVFAVHFPAPFHPRRLREQSLAFLTGLASKLPKGRLVVAAGDFNITDTETEILKPHANQWIVTHQVACATCRGTSYYPPKESWSFLDMILLSKSLGTDGRGTWTWVPDSFAIVAATAEQKDENGRPVGFDLPVGPKGVSDHFPLFVKLRTRPESP